VKDDAFGECLRDFPGVGGHLAARLQADQVDLGCTQAQRATGGVDRHIAAADDDYLLAFEVLQDPDGTAGERVVGGRGRGRGTPVRGLRGRGQPVIDHPQEIQRRQDAGELLAVHPQPGRTVRPDRDEDGVEALPLESSEVVDPRTADDLDTEVGDVPDIAGHDVLREAVGGYRQAEHTARL